MVGRDIENLSLSRQCELLNISRSGYYYKHKGISTHDLNVMKIIDEIYTMHPYYGTRRMAKYLQVQGFEVSRKGVRRYYQIMGLEAIYPKINLSKRNQVHKVYPYLLKGLEIVTPNQVWSSDITYIRLEQGMVGPFV